MRSFTLLLLTAAGAAPAADLSKIDRSISKEPAYAGKPRYCLLAFGHEARHRVWLVQDGATLYVDRDGNGDLTQPGEKVAARKADGRQTDEAFGFDVGELRVGGKTHKGLVVALMPMKTLADNANLMAMPHLAKTVRKSPGEMTGSIDLDVESDSLKGGGVGGRLSYMISLFDTQGLLQFGTRPADAPVLHFDGPLQVTFYGGKPTWTGGGTDDTVLCIGTPGVGPGTFAMLKYEGTIPEGKHPKLAATYRPKDQSRPPVKELYELKERC